MFRFNRNFPRKSFCGSSKRGTMSTSPPAGGSQGLSWGCLGALLASPEPLFGPPGALFAASWPVFGLLGISRAAPGLSWASLFGSLGPAGGNIATKCLKIRPRGIPGSQNGPPKSDLFMSCSVLIFGPPSGHPFGRFSGRVTSQNLRF